MNKQFRKKVLSTTAALLTGLVEGMLIQHYRIAPALGTATFVHGAIQLTDAAQDITTGITHPDFARVLSVKGNVSGINKVVTITGTNIKGEVITSDITCNGATEVFGTKAFRTVTNIHVLSQNHAGVAQVETATAAGTITGTGNASVVVTAAGMTGSPKTLGVAVTSGDTAADWAAKVRAALATDSAVTALFSVGGTGASIALTRLTPVANDATLNIALDNGTSTGITPAASSANTTAGVPYDLVSIGVGNIFGLPNIVDNAALLLVKNFNGSTDSGTLAVDEDEVEKNLFSINGTPDGAKLLDLYYLV